MHTRSGRAGRWTCAAVLSLSACGGGNGGGRGSGTSAMTFGTTAATTATTGAGTGSATGGGSTGTATTGVTGSGGHGPVFDVGGGSTGSGSCVPVSTTEMVCDGKDDDCNGFVDDVDVGGDGICDCLSIALLGQPGTYASSQFVTWLTMQGTSSTRIDPAAIDDTMLQPYDVIIIDQLTRSYGATEITAFSNWVSGGGGLMAMTGHTANTTSTQTWPNGILGSFQIAYQGPLLDGPVTDFFPHPITVGLTSVTFLGGFEVAETSSGVTDPVAQLPAAVIARARDFGNGRVFVWGDEWIEYDSQWSTMPEIHQLWVNILEWLRPKNICAPPPG